MIKIISPMVGAIKAIEHPNSLIIYGEELNGYYLVGPVRKDFPPLVINIPIKIGEQIEELILHYESTPPILTKAAAPLVDMAEESRLSIAELKELKGLFINDN